MFLESPVTTQSRLFSHNHPTKFLAITGMILHSSSFKGSNSYTGGFSGWAVVKSLPAMQEMQEVGSIPGSRRSPGAGNGNLFQYSCLENSRDRGDWWAAVHGAAKSQT